MSIDRDIDRLSPVKNKPRDKQPTPMPQSSSASSLRLGGQIDNRIGLKQADIMNQSGNATLDTGNFYDGYPQQCQELVGYGEKALFVDNIQGNFALDVSLSNVFALNLAGPTTISINTANWPLDSYAKNNNNGVDLSLTLLINKGNFPLSISTNHWGPRGAAPDMNRAGYYEINIAACVFPTFSVVRAWPTIVPPLPES